jgi:hypothetical protein
MAEISLTGQFGFEVFQSQSNQLFYFHFNDEKGQALLYSQGYQNARTRDNSLQSVVNNAAIADRYEGGSDGEKHFFILRAANHQAIGQSRLFPNKKELEQAKKLMLTMGENPPVHPRNPEAPATPKSPQVKTAMPEPAAASETRPPAPANDPRQSFRITLYKEPGSARIEHVLTQEYATVKGISGEEIANFILSHLPEDWRPIFEQTKPQVKAAVLKPLEIQAVAPTAPVEKKASVTAAVTDLAEDVPNPAVPVVERRPSMDDVIEQFMESEKVKAPAKEFSPREIKEMLRKQAAETAPPPAESEANEFIKGTKVHPVVEANRQSSGDDVMTAFFQTPDFGEFVKSRVKGVSFDPGFLKGEKPAPPPPVSRVEAYINTKGTVEFEPAVKAAAVKTDFPEIVQKAAQPVFPQRKKTDVVDEFIRGGACGCKL